MNKHYENIHRYDFLTKELLEEEYIKNGLSDGDIAKKYKMPSKAVVWRKRKKFKIENRHPAKSNKHATKNRKFNLTKKRAQKYIDDGLSRQEIADEMGCSLMVAKRRLAGLDLCETQESTEKYAFYDVELTESQKQLLIGSVLGDGTISVSNAYSCSHGTEQADYHKHKRTTLASISSGAFQEQTHKKKSTVTGKNYKSVHFTTGCNAYCRMLRELFYPNGTKIFPYYFLLDNMKAEALAYWYMDDGSFNKTNKSATLLTYGYTPLEQVMMKHLLLELFGIDSHIHRDKARKIDKSYFHCFTVAETRNLFNLVRPYIVESMIYKIKG